MRKDFFQSFDDKSILVENATSAESSLRWAAAVELGEIPEPWSVELLWQLKDDSDNYVSAVANKALSGFDPLLIEKAVFHKESIKPDVDHSQTLEFSENEVAAHVSWKTRPLEPPSEINDWAVSAAILDIVNTEGPMTGPRLMRLYGESVFPNSPKKLSKHRMQNAVERLSQRSVITVSNSSVEGIDGWTLFRTGTPEIAVRDRGSRSLSEIPVTEVAALVRLRSRRGATLNRNRQFQLIIEAYEIPQSELHIAGAVLDNEWRDLLSRV
jgi:hypothetical protein